MGYELERAAAGHDIREEIKQVCHRIYNHGWVAANDGNVSVRVAEDEVVVTPTGVSKGVITRESLVDTNMKGEPQSPGRASSEVRVHLYCYRERPEIKSVVHAHPPYATGFAVAGEALDKCVLPEIVLTVGSIPLAKYGLPGTDELADTLAPHIHNSDVFLLANHGAVALGRDVWEAYYQMERLEHFAKISYVARMLGGEKLLSEREVGDLFELRRRAGFGGLNPGCWTCSDECIGDTCVNYPQREDPNGRDEIGDVVKRVLDAVR